MIALHGNMIVDAFLAIGGFGNTNVWYIEVKMISLPREKEIKKSLYKDYE